MEPEVQVYVYLEKVRFRVGMYFTQHYTANSLKDVETPQGGQSWDLSSVTML